MRERAVIFDIDGTIADLEHFDVFVPGRQKRPEEINRFLGFARPIKPVIKLLREAAKKYKILFLTARPEETRQLTVEWLNKNVGISNYELFMRQDEDNREPEVVKAQQLKLGVLDRFDPQFAVDDNPANRQMFKQHGIPTIDPADIPDVME